MDSKLLNFTRDIDWPFSFCGRNSVYVGKCYFSYYCSQCW